MDWTDGLMVSLTALSVGGAAVALGYARRATEAAAGAVLVAKDANKLAKDANKISEQSNTIAEQAAKDARDAPTSVAWDEYVVALAALQNFDPTARDVSVGPLLTSLRTRATLLIDRLGWEHFDKWVAAEQLAGVMLMREASEGGERERQRLRRDLSPDEALEIDERFHLWVAAYTMNVRVCRKKGPTETPFEALTTQAWESIEATANRNGWPVPPDKVEGIEPYEPQ